MKVTTMGKEEDDSWTGGVSGILHSLSFSSFVYYGNVNKAQFPRAIRNNPAVPSEADKLCYPKNAD